MESEPDDAAVRNFAQVEVERRRQQEVRDAELGQRVSAAERNRAAAVPQSEIDAATNAYKLTREQVDKVTELLCSAPQLASRLSFDASVRLLYPESVARAEDGAS